MGIRFYVSTPAGETPTGLPEVPTEWRQYLLERPVVATVKKVKKNTDIILDVGEEAGLKPGMFVYGRDPLTNAYLGSWEIKSVGYKTALASQEHDFNDPGTVGLQVSTRAAE
jgi:hypothetical protein